MHPTTCAWASLFNLLLWVLDSGSQRGPNSARSRSRQTALVSVLTRMQGQPRLLTDTPPNQPGFSPALRASRAFPVGRPSRGSAPTPHRHRARALQEVTRNKMPPVRRPQRESGLDGENRQGAGGPFLLPALLSVSLRLFWDRDKMSPEPLPKENRPSDEAASSDLNRSSRRGSPFVRGVVTKPPAPPPASPPPAAHQLPHQTRPRGGSDDGARPLRPSHLRLGGGRVLPTPTDVEGSVTPEGSFVV